MMMRPAIAPQISDSIGRLVIKAKMKTSRVGRTDTKPRSLMSRCQKFAGFSLSAVYRNLSV